MAQQIINVGEVANDGTGESLRNAFTAVNNNFTQIWNVGPVGSQVLITGNVITTSVNNLELTLAGNGIGNIQANSSIVPGTPGVYDLGAPDNPFQYIYGDYLVGNGALLTGIVATSSYNNANVAAFLPTYTGNLVSLTGPVRTTANVIAGNIITSGFLGVSGAITGGNITGNNLISSGSVSAVGNIVTGANIAGSYLLGNGAFITGITATNIAAAALTGDTLSSNVLYSSLKVVDNLLYLDVVGNITTSGKFIGSGAGLTNIPGANIVGSVANAAYANVAGTAYLVAGANVTGAVANATYAVSAGTATTANTATVATYATTANSVSGANVSGTVANATYAVTAGSATTATTAIAAATVTTAAQPNITSVGTLTSVSVAGNATAGNISTSGKISAVGNITGNYFIGNGALLTGVAASNVNANALTGDTLSSNVLYSSLKVVDDLLYLDVIGNITTQGKFIGSGAGLINIPAANITGTVANAAYANVAGTAYLVAGANVTGAVANATYAVAAGSAASANTATVATYATTANSVSGANVAGAVANATYAVTAGSATTATTAIAAGTVTTAAQPNITSVGTLTSVTVAGNATAGNILTGGKISVAGNVSGNYFIGNGSQLTGVVAASVNANSLTGDVLSSNVVYSSLKVVDDLYYLDVIGNVSGNYFKGNGSLLTGIVATGVGVLANLSVTGNTQTGNLLTSGKVSATGNISGNYLIGNGALITGIIASAGAAITNGNSNVTVNANGNITVGAIGTSNVAVFAPTGAYIVGEVSATGNVTGNYLLGNGALITGLPAGYSNADVANYLPTYTGNLASLTGPVTTTSDITGGNLVTSGLVSATGNVTGNYILGNGALLTGVITSVANINNGTSNVTVVSSGGNITVGVDGTANVAVFATTGEYITGLLSASGNITGANLLTAGQLSAAGNVVGNYFIGNGSQLTGVAASSVYANALIGNTLSSNVLYSSLTQVGTLANLSVTANVTGGNVLTSGLISATGNIIGGNVNTSNIRPLSGALTISTGTGNLNLQPAGNIVLSNAIITGVAYPQQDTDAASKIYVDNMISTGLSYHSPVSAATTTTLAATTGGTITYTQPNGAANGVGALLTTTGSFNLIDTANVQTVGTRILVKNEGNAVYNGVYTWANATNIIRSTDTDQYGPDSTEDLSLNDYFFVQGGTVNKGGAWVVSAPAGTITFGTSNITFSQFSSSQTYTANADAGISLIGTQINAKVDQNTTAFDGGGNIVVKANANLTTPNIGAATGTSLSVTGNVTGNYILGNGSQLTGILGSNVNMGTNSAGQLISNAVTLTTGTTVTNGIALLNQVLGKLVPPAPPNFPNSTAISLSGTSTYRMANITQVDNTPGANKAVVAGTSVATVLRVATYATSTVTNAGPGDAGTITAVRNGIDVGNVTLNASASPSGNGTYGSNLVISNNFDYNSANANITAGFWYVFSARVSGATAPAGWNELYIADSSTANTNTTVWYYDNSSPSTPAFSSASMTPPVSANLLYSSTIPHYTNNNNFTIAFTVANISGNTYPTSNTLASGSGGGAFASPVIINYSSSNIGSNVLNSFASATANTTASITTGFGSSSTGPSMSVNNSYSTGTLTLTTALANTVLWKSGTATAIDESNVVINTTIGTGSGNAYRILNPGTGNTPVYTGSEAAFNSQSSTLQTYDATVVGSGSSGVLKHDQTNYSTSYLPAGPNLSSGRTGTQYFTIKFVRTAVSKFDIKYTGNIAGMWVALPGSVIDSSSSANGWINMAVAYGGAGYPGVNSPGNGSDGCATGGIVTLNTSVTNSSKTCTFGTVSSSSTATNEIYVRIALTSGQSVTALTLETASN